MNSSSPAKSPSAPPSERLARRSIAICGAIAVGIGLCGFLVGIAEPVLPTRAVASLARAELPVVPAAPVYAAIDSSVVGPNREWASEWSALKQERPGLFEPVARTPEMKADALFDRLRTRAFDGAPPVVPHPVEQRSAANCLVCHEHGMKLGQKLATKVSHPHYANCLQCHVEQTGSVPATVESPGPVGGRNEFAGVRRSGPGTRALWGAPPTIPHTLQLREDCQSCHGLIARPGLRTTHPWLRNCRQCHVAERAAEDPAVAALGSLEERVP